MIEESVAFLVAQGKRVVYDAEHCFDGWRDDPEYARRCVRAAAEAGAETVALCDTNGGSLPGQIAEATRDLAARARRHRRARRDPLPQRPRVRRRQHARGRRGGRDARAGDDERLRRARGNANLVSIVPNLQLKLGYDCLPVGRLATLTETAHYLDELLNRTPNPDQPYVGKNAFAHGGGMHVDGVLKDPSTFEHIDPALVGNDRELLISELSGKGTVLARAEQARLDARRRRRRGA